MADMDSKGRLPNSDNETWDDAIIEAQRRVNGRIIK